jgi:hypothetical protein
VEAVVRDDDHGRLGEVDARDEVAEGLVGVDVGLVDGAPEAADLVLRDRGAPRRPELHEEVRDGVDLLEVDEGEVGRGRAEVEARDRVHAPEEPDLELEREPAAPPPRREALAAALEDDRRGVARGGDLDLPRRRDLARPSAEPAVERPGELRPDAPALDAHLHRPPARERPRRPRREERERPLRPADVGDAHAREHAPADLLGRERDGAADHDRGDARVAGRLPERLSTPRVMGVRRPEAEGRDREVGEVRPRVARDEVEEAVLPRVDPVAKVDHATGDCAGFVVARRP